MVTEGVEVKVERIYRLDSESALKGFADISVAGSFIIKGLRIVAGKKGLFVGMPQEQGRDGKWYNRVHLVNESLKEKLADMVLSAFEE
ncbi:MAG: septation protein SpoVG family protein [Candidatus Omnitrophica bacterium]|nr:septation protein SpoVG family protein [Candidatus Omnitrophota bacterium]